MDLVEEIVRKPGPLLVLGGPGTGKTRALARRIRYLVKERPGEPVNPTQITVITFTNEAANNMRRRISTRKDKTADLTYLDPELQPRRICTMHKLGHQVITENHAKLNLPRAVKVLSSAAQKRVLMKDCAQIAGGRRQDAADTLLCREHGKCVPEDCLQCRICGEYKNLLNRLGFIDYDDQIMLACKLLREEQDVRRRLQRTTRHLLVDEYQDINYAQWDLIRLLSKGRTDGLFVAGDEFQSIYGYRGASPEFIRRFELDYRPNGEAFRLTTCYRCPPKIYRGALEMVQAYNDGRSDLARKLSFKGEGSDAPIKICIFKNQNSEADFIARKLMDVGPSYDSLILVPKSAMAFPIKRALRKRHVEFSSGFEVEDTELYVLGLLLRWLEKGRDDIHLRNILFRMVLEEIINRNLSAIPCERAEVSGGDEIKLAREAAMNRMSSLWKAVRRGRTLYQEARGLGKTSPFEGLMDTVCSLRTAASSRDDVEGFISVTVSVLKLWGDVPKLSREVRSVLQEIDSLAKSSPTPPVRILTIAKAKGLEADYVFVVGLENGLLPSADGNKSQTQEDSRKLYVSMTRTKKELFLLHSEMRTRDITKVEATGQSDFLSKIPPRYVAREDHTRSAPKSFP